MITLYKLRYGKGYTPLTLELSTIDHTWVTDKASNLAILVVYLP